LPDQELCFVAVQDGQIPKGGGGMIWPWSKIRLLESELAYERARNKDLLWRYELRENLMLKAMREQAGAHKGIRRLKAKLKKYELKERGR